jgi:hypothetical protein
MLRRIHATLQELAELSASAVCFSRRYTMFRDEDLLGILK